jgi:hypothetical protein
MISHKYKCIFVHIARTAGTSVENLFMKGDWWAIDRQTKHAPAFFLKLKYGRYWDDYFKFSIVRDPYDRFRSLYKYYDHYGLELNGSGEIILDKYRRFWNYPEVCESHRHVEVYNQLNYVNLKRGSAYQNFLGNELDKVYRFENLSEISRDFADRFGLDGFLDHFKECTTSEKPPLSASAIGLISEIHADDFDHFGYSRHGS